MGPESRAAVSHAAVFAVLTVALAAPSCRSSHPLGDRYFESGRFLEAAAVYRSYLDSGAAEGEERARAMLRLGVSYAVPASPLYDPQLAVEVLQELLRLDPRGSYSVEAALIRDLQIEVLALGTEIERRQVRLHELQADLQQARSELENLDQQLAQRDQAIATSRRELGVLAQQIQNLQRELVDKQLELDRLKAIDLEIPH